MKGDQRIEGGAPMDEPTEPPRGCAGTEEGHSAAGWVGTVPAHYWPSEGFAWWPQWDKPPICLISPPFPGERPLNSHNPNLLWATEHRPPSWVLKRQRNPQGKGKEERGRWAQRSGAYGGVCQSAGRCCNGAAGRAPELECVCVRAHAPQVWRGRVSQAV